MPNEQDSARKKGVCSAIWLRLTNRLSQIKEQSWWEYLTHLFKDVVLFTAFLASSKFVAWISECWSVEGAGTKFLEKYLFYIGAILLVASVLKSAFVLLYGLYKELRQKLSLINIKSQADPSTDSEAQQDSKKNRKPKEVRNE